MTKINIYLKMTKFNIFIINNLKRKVETNKLNLF